MKCHRLSHLAISRKHIRWGVGSRLFDRNLISSKEFDWRLTSVYRILCTLLAIGDTSGTREPSQIFLLGIRLVLFLNPAQTVSNDEYKHSKDGEDFSTRCMVCDGFSSHLSHICIWNSHSNDTRRRSNRWIRIKSQRVDSRIENIFRWTQSTKFRIRQQFTICRSCTNAIKIQSEDKRNRRNILQCWCCGNY